MIENPWLTFNPQENEPKVHKTDLPFFQGFNKGMNARVGTDKKNYVLAEHLEPLPYLGNPKANVLVLMANPGVSEKENLKFRMDPSKRLLNGQNLRHENLESFRSRIDLPKGSKLESAWFKPRVRELVEKTSVDRVVPLEVKAGGITIHHVRALHASAINKSTYPRRLLLIQYCAVDAWPIGGAGDWDKFNDNILRGEPTNRPRMTDVPVLMPLPTTQQNGDTIYSIQAKMAKKSFM